MTYTQATNLDGSRCYFDYSKATAFQELYSCNGSLTLSVNTNAQHSHEELLRTAGGHWILRRWSEALSCWQDSAETFHVIEEEAAFDWLIRNDEAEHVPPEALKAWEAKNVLP